MILQALTRYYEALAAKGILDRPGWDKAFKVSYGLELADDGSLLQLHPLKTPPPEGQKGKPAPRKLCVPAHTTRTAGVKAEFLCDNASYLLGADAKGKPQRAKECFAAARALHHAILDGVDTPAAQAVLAFFDRWDPGNAPAHPLLAADWEDLCTGNLIFYHGFRPVTEDQQIAQAWQRHYDAASDSGPPTQCLVTGQVAPVARLHPLFKGVPGAQSSGAALVSFNAPAFNSFGQEQGGNAPVSTYAAFAYGAALNYLLAGRDHRHPIGNTTVVCWAEHGESAYQDFNLAALFGIAGTGMTEKDLTTYLDLLAQGRAFDWQGITLDPGEHFYLLGLAPNAARLSVSFFLADTFGNFARNIERHYQDLAIYEANQPAPAQPPLWRLLYETVNQNARTKAPADRLAGDVLRAMLNGTPYPATLLNGVTLRIRADRTVNATRAAILKAYYRRVRNSPIPEEVLTVKLNEDTRYDPYILGRLFAVLEKTQQEAAKATDPNRKLNTTIKDRYFNSASATPASVFPVLIKLAQKHLAKLTEANQVYYNKQLTELIGRLQDDFPPRMTLPDQGAFQIGYYQQMQKFFTKKEETSHV